MIKLFFMDVDGTLTDGKIYMGAAGELMKAFHVKDGHAIKNLLPQYHMTPVIITGRASEIVTSRAQELNIGEIYQGVDNKLEVMLGIVEKYHYSLEDAAYIGDDIGDLPCMLQCGLSACPSDAADELLAAADYVCAKRGGEGAVREFVEWLLRKESGGTFTR